MLNRGSTVNMASTVERSLVMNRDYVIKEVDTAALPSFEAFEAMQEIELLAELVPWTLLFVFPQHQP